MRWHIKQKKKVYNPVHGVTAHVNHPIFDRCTLYLQEVNGVPYGLAVIQQRIDRKKRTYWEEIDSWLVDEIFEHPGFQDYFKKRAKPRDDWGESFHYPTVTVRQIMWALKMKPLTKQRWETTFDRKEI